MRIWPQMIQTYSFTDALNPGIYFKFLDIQRISAHRVRCVSTVLDRELLLWWRLHLLLQI